MPSSTPMSSCVAQVKDEPKSKPCESRLVAFTCSELYHVSPRGAQCMLAMLPNSGNGRRACATVEPVGKLAYGGVLKPMAAARGELIGEARSCRSVALLRLSPWAARICGVSLLIASMNGEFHQTPRLPTYAASTIKFGAISRCKPRLHWI